MTLYRTPNGTPYLSFTLCAICHRAIGQLAGLRYGDAGQRPHDRQWRHVVPITDVMALHPARVPWDDPDEPTPPPLDLADVVARMTASVEVSLRQLLDLVGVPYTEPIVEPKRQFAPHHLGAMREAWAEGYDDGHANGRRKYDGTPDNPYAKLLDDRRQFVREQVEGTYGGGLVTDDDEFVLGDDNAEWFDAVLDAHDEWRSLQQPDAALVDARIRAEQAEARVAELDGVLHRIADTANLRPGRVTVEDGLDDVRTVLTRAGYGTQLGGWVPPYSADRALSKIWDLVKAGDSEATYDGVRAILDEMGYHEHVHTRFATEPDRTTIPPTMPECGETQGREQTFDGRALICHLPAGHDGPHLDNTAGVTWS
ncbi:hypothetical protein SEA_PHAUCI_50 [Gordonia Phage Phauci]|uniref:Uncharacterized protein n=1 Tax=Gordonia Phage Phauci TaxID=2951392 RepID=A0A9E7NJD2_9CAUD|nr:hypothetical protein SEA_PHAUCI_50 [Gordonia Phage Phauci]